MGRGADQDKGVAPGSSPKRPVEGGCEDCWKMLVMAGKLLAAGALVVEKVKLLLGPAERTKHLKGPPCSVKSHASMEAWQHHQMTSSSISTLMQRVVAMTVQCGAAVSDTGQQPCHHYSSKVPPKNCRAWSDDRCISIGIAHKTVSSRQRDKARPCLARTMGLVRCSPGLAFAR